MNGLLQTAFIVSYMLFSPVFGYLGDRFTRKYIISGGILAWAACTLLGSFSVVSVHCSSSTHTHTHTHTRTHTHTHTHTHTPSPSVQNYWMLLSSRGLVGIGEASYATIAPTMIADLFPPEKRLRMLSVFYIAMPLGSATGYILGSRVSQLVFSITGQPGSWQWALRVSPSPSLPPSLCLVCVSVSVCAIGHTTACCAAGYRGAGTGRGACQRCS